MHGAAGAGAPDGSGLGRPGPGGRNRRRDAPANRQRADPHHGARGGRQLGADSARQVVAQPRAALRLGGVIVLSLPRGERAGHLRLGARAAPRILPQGAHRTLYRRAAHRGAHPAGLPHRAAPAPARPCGPLRQPFGAAARLAARPQNPLGGACRAPHRPLAEPRPLLRPARGALALAAGPLLADVRGPLYAELRAALPGPHARKCGGVRPAAPRAGLAEPRGAGRQRRRRELPRGERRRRMVGRRCGLCTPPAGLPDGREPLPAGHNAPRAEHHDRGREPRRVAGRHPRTRGVCPLRELRLDAGERRRRPLYGPPPGRREPLCRQPDDGGAGRGSTSGASFSMRGSRRPSCFRTVRGAPEASSRPMP